MKVIVGLGNPGKKYELTRHNIGFWAVDQLSEKWNILFQKEKWHSAVAEGIVNGEKVFLLKPLTYMNLSGEAVGAAMRFLKLAPEDLLVIFDDMDIPLGQLRLRQKGSSGGHNGMKSIISHLGTDQFNRIKIGIDRPPAGMKVVDYVLEPFSEIDHLVAADAAIAAANATNEWLKNDFLIAMNKYNGAVPRL
ncbi:aminoacyl-tRNA hydrolase [Shimazuella sp. AN120528]|uniref:aminoacyl-tRNA hydrolase n=1 Tax=Shimazuella soli TaxID=1892854 RepID=UPI001F0DF413|nr:aminoacyl-tRNA hydrolase [Shimazuella soli]MCH5585856.1 aminoacyl-tRNA hydrolase [Shimazuella soli]